MIKNIINDVEPQLKLLPLTHNTDVYNLREILKTKKISPQPCSIFDGENNTYTFYGKPSYRVKSNYATKNIAFYPVCFILDSSKLPSISNIYPFDSGAFLSRKDLRDKFFHPKMNIESFELDKNYESILKLITYFYNSNEDYVSGTPKKEMKIPITQLELISYYNMIKNEENSVFDDRISSVEIKYQNEIQLNEQAIVGIILPKPFLQDEQIRHTIENELKVKYIKSYLLARGNPSEFQGFIYNSFIEMINQ